MIEQSVDGAGTPPLEPQGGAEATAQSAGALLRRAREAQGLHIAALAVSLKVPVRKLEALEADRHELLTDVVFTRALAASVCRALKMDPAPVMERLPRSTVPELGREGNAQNVPFKLPHGRAPLALPELLTRPAVLISLALVVGAAVLILLPGRQAADPASNGVRIESAVPAPGGAAAPAAATAASDPVMPSTTLPAPTGSTPAAAPAAAAPASAPASGPAALAAPMPGAPVSPAASATAATSVPAAAGPSAAAASAAALGFRTTNPSWIEVVDAAGTQLLRRSVGPNEAIEVSGPAPLRVTVGNVGHTRVEVRGKPFDLIPVTRGNVASFEVR